jgi:glutamine synthetase adenylyltransferase
VIVISVPIIVKANPATKLICIGCGSKGATVLEFTGDESDVDLIELAPKQRSIYEPLDLETLYIL